MPFTGKANIEHQEGDGKVGPNSLDFDVTGFVDGRKPVVANAAEGLVKVGRLTAVFLKSHDDSGTEFNRFRRNFLTRKPNDEGGGNAEKLAVYHKLFNETVSYAIDVKRKSANSGKLNVLITRLWKTMGDIYGDISFDDFMTNFNGAVAERESNTIFLRSLPILMAKDSSVSDKYCNRFKSLEDAHNRGEITENEYLQKKHEIIAEAVRETGDKKLQKEFEQSQKEPIYYSATDFSLSSSNGAPVTNKDEMKSAFSTMVDSGMNYSVNSDGSASIVVGDDFPVDVFVNRNVETGEFYYYIKDEYAKDGFTRADASNFLLALDRRHIDAFISKRIGILPDESASVSDISDKDIVFIGEKVLGADAKKRGYRIEDKGREILEALAVVLKTPDDKYTTLGKRVEVLRDFLEAEHNEELVRRKLGSGKFRSLGDLMEE